jgi:hypothetical protein
MFISTSRLQPGNFMINDEKRLLQQYRPLSSVAVMQQIGSDRKESGHRADIVNRSKMTGTGSRDVLSQSSRGLAHSRRQRRSFESVSG